jgi:hydroxymethylpyrimidine pyrophosphatase-like HAD family hydrolase
MIRLIALDIDGTLLASDGELPPANRAAIERAVAAGVHVVLATGRRYDFARTIFEQLPAAVVLILSNGAVVKTRDGETLARNLLPRAVARDVLTRIPRSRDLTALVFDRPREGQVVFESIDWEHERHRRFFEVNRPFLAEVVPLEDALIEDPVQVMFTGGCADMRALYQQLLQHDSTRLSEACGEAAVVERPSPSAPYSVALTEYLHRDFSLVDVLCAGCSKGTALAQHAAALGIEPSEVMAVGDNLNDLEMLEFAGTPVVMANAIDELKSRGWHLTASNDEAGVARAMERVMFGAER